MLSEHSGCFVRALQGLPSPHLSQDSSYHTGAQTALGGTPQRGSSEKQEVIIFKKTHLKLNTKQGIQSTDFISNFQQKLSISQVWRYTLLMPAPGRQRQGDGSLKACLIVLLSSRTQDKTEVAFIMT